MNARECAMEYKRCVGTNDPVSIGDLAEGNGLSRKEITSELDNEIESCISKLEEEIEYNSIQGCNYIIARYLLPELEKYKGMTYK